MVAAGGSQPGGSSAAAAEASSARSASRPERSRPELGDCGGRPSQGLPRRPRPKRGVRKCRRPLGMPGLRQAIPQPSAGGGSCSGSHSEAPERRWQRRGGERQPSGSGARKRRGSEAGISAPWRWIPAHGRNETGIQTQQWWITASRSSSRVSLCHLRLQRRKRFDSSVLHSFSSHQGASAW